MHTYKLIVNLTNNTYLYSDLIRLLHVCMRQNQYFSHVHIYVSWQSKPRYNSFTRISRSICIFFSHKACPNKQAISAESRDSRANTTNKANYSTLVLILPYLVGVTTESNKRARDNHAVWYLDSFGPTRLFSILDRKQISLTRSHTRYKRSRSNTRQPATLL